MGANLGPPRCFRGGYSRLSCVFLYRSVATSSTPSASPEGLPHIIASHGQVDPGSDWDFIGDPVQ